MSKQAQHTPRIVVVAEGSVQRLAFTEAVQQCGYEVLACVPSNRLDEKTLALSPDLWLIDADDCIGVIEKLTSEDKYLLGFTPAPKITETKGFGKWQRRLQRKLYQMLGSPPDTTAPAQEREKASKPAPLQASLRLVVVLGASLGGPKAVKAFLDHLPHDLPLALVLAQHMDDKAVDSLTSVLTRNNMWHCQVVRQTTNLEQGVVYVLPPESPVTFHHFGISLSDAHWQSNYKPCISEVLLAASYVYSHRLVGIIFSGMESDGSSAAHTVVEHKGQYWAQSPQSSECDSQPLAAINTGFVGFQGTPEGLAAELMRHLTQISHWPNAYA